MDFEVSKAQQKFVDKVGKACEELRPVEEQYYLKQEYNEELVPIFKKHNLLAMTMSKKYGGLGLDLNTYLLALQRISQEGHGVRTFFSVHTSLGQYLVERWGNTDQKKILKDTVSGKRVMGFALTEPEAGSDAASLRTTFEKKGKNYVLNGTKMWISNATVGDTFVTFARNKKNGKISAFIVESDFDGFGSERLNHKIGLHSSDTGNLHFNNCVVPVENLLGPKDHGMRVALNGLMGGRLGIAISCIGVMEDCLKEAVQYSKERVQFGKPIGKNQLIQKHLAIMKENLESAKWYTYYAGFMKDKYEQGQADRDEVDGLLASAKHYATNACFDVANRAVQIFGAKGYFLHYRVARHFADTRVTMIYEGANEILEQKVALSLLGNKYSAFR